jgi:hypothetical protein
VTRKEVYTSSVKMQPVFTNISDVLLFESMNEDYIDTEDHSPDSLGSGKWTGQEHRYGVMGVLVAERSEVENCGWILEG